LSKEVSSKSPDLPTPVFSVAWALVVYFRWVQLLILQAFPGRFEGKRAVFQGLMGQGAVEKEYGAYPCRYLHAARSLLHEDSR